MSQPAFVSYAQNYEDVMLWRALGGVGRGFYIDVGACEPLADSVTQAFYERGWTGINIEPAPAAFARLDAARPRDINLQLAAGAQAGEADFLLVDGGNGLSTLRTELRDVLEADWPVVPTRVAVRRLADICREQVRGAIHFLKIDAEGAERAVLQGAELAVWRPWVVLVEATVVNSAAPNHHVWEDLLLGQRYRFVYADGLNRFYLAEEHAGLEAAFALPPNLFDGFIRCSELAATTEAAALKTQAEALTADLADARWRAEVAHAAERLGAEQLAQAQAALAAAGAREAAACVERDGAVGEMWESNRLAAVLASDRQKLVDQLAASVPAALLAQVHASTSWRLSAPLRVLGRARRRLGRTG